MSEHPRARLSAYLDGELPSDEAADVERHLRGCTECSRELAILNRLGGAMRSMSGSGRGRSVWHGVHRRITRPLGWILLLVGLAVWAALVGSAWWTAEVTAEWAAGTGVTVGLLMLLVAVGYEQYREWKDTRYKDVER
jgi:anti-sigma factor RsiW